MQPLYIASQIRLQSGTGIKQIVVLHWLVIGDDLAVGCFEASATLGVDWQA